MVKAMICVGCEADVEQYAKNKRCRRCYNEYMKTYMLSLYQDRQIQAVALLGGKCHRCSTRIGLKVEYREGTRKLKKTSSLYSMGEDRFRGELTKCILLCRRCHTTWQAQRNSE